MRAVRPLGMFLVLSLPWAATLGDDASSSLERLLQTESQEPTDRRGQLSTLRKSSNLPARWLSGYVPQGGEWVPFENRQLSAGEQSARKAYKAARAKSGWNAADQAALADWCHRRNLLAEEYAHSLAVVALSPELDHHQRLQQLGFAQVGGVWLSPERLQEWRAEIRLTQVSLATWRKRLARAVELWREGGRKRKIADDTFDALRDSEAVPAIEWMLCGQEEPLVLLAIDRLKAIDTAESTKALARQAIFNKWWRARDAAAAVLADRTLEDFVPALISLLATTIETRTAAVADQGFLGYALVMFRETDDQFQIERFEVLAQGIAPTSSVSETIMLRVQRVRTDASFSAPPTFGDRLQLERALADQAFANSVKVEEQNARTQEVNSRVSKVLGKVSGETKRETPRDWWDWWSDHNEYVKGQPKSVRQRTTRSFGTVGILPNQFVYSSTTQVSSCLVAGTPVWTDEGPRPIEELQVGDQILSQDVESGELGYVAVLQTTVREATRVFRVHTGSNSFTANGGHRFWVPGAGWRRVNDLQTGTLLHTATGSVAVTAIEPVPDAAVYNVVISPTHNYFIGEQALLSHDVTIPRSTNRKVPGLVSAR